MLQRLSRLMLAVVQCGNPQCLNISMQASMRKRVMSYHAGRELAEECYLGLLVAEKRKSNYV